MLDWQSLSFKGKGPSYKVLQQSEIKVGDEKNAGHKLGAGQFEHLQGIQRTVIGVVGPESVAKDEEEAFRDLGLQLGAQLGRANYAVAVLGGGIFSKAVLEGARQQGGELVAILSEPQDLAPSVKIEQKATQLQAMERLGELSAALILAYGGLSSMAALMNSCSMALQGNAPFRQTLLLGEKWKGLWEMLIDAASLGLKEKNLVSHAPSVEEAVESLRYYSR